MYHSGVPELPCTSVLEIYTENHSSALREFLYHHQGSKFCLLFINVIILIVRLQR